jgi:hypothetical protein
VRRTAGCRKRSRCAGTQFTCFTCTKVQILTALLIQLAAANERAAQLGADAKEGGGLSRPGGGGAGSGSQRGPELEELEVDMDAKWGGGMSRSGGVGGGGGGSQRQELEAEMVWASAELALVREKHDAVREEHQAQVLGLLALLVQTYKY